MLVIDRATRFNEVWKAVSDVPPPALAQIVRWCLKFDDALMERAILKAGAKFNRTGADTERVHRYATKLMFNLHNEREEGRCKASLTAWLPRFMTRDVDAAQMAQSMDEHVAKQLAGGPHDDAR